MAGRFAESVSALFYQWAMHACSDWFEPRKTSGHCPLDGREVAVLRSPSVATSSVERYMTWLWHFAAEPLAELDSGLKSLEAPDMEQFLKESLGTPCARSNSIDLPPRYLQHTTPAQLYDGYLAWHDDRFNADESESKAASYSVFKKVWRQWHPKVNQHSKFAPPRRHFTLPTTQPAHHPQSGITRTHTINKRRGENYT